MVDPTALEEELSGNSVTVVRSWANRDRVLGLFHLGGAGFSDVQLKQALERSREHADTLVGVLRL